MPQLGDENEKVTNSVIPNGTEAKVMRNLIENKGLLNGKGKLYAGTADTTSTGAPVTTAIDPSGADDGSVLIKDSTQTGGWKVDKVGKDNIKDAAITPEKLDSTKEYSVKNITANGNVIIQTERDDVTWAGGGMQYTKNSNYGGEILVPDRSMDTPETFATEEEIKRQIESGEIVAKTASSLKGNSSSQNQLFTSKKGTQNWAEFHEQSVLSTDGVTSIQLGPKDLTTSNGIISGTFFTPSVDNLGVGLYVVHDIGSHFFGIACIYDIGDQGEYGYDVALWGGIKMTNGKGTLKANTTLRALKIGWVNSLTSAANVFNALGLV